MADVFKFKVEGLAELQRRLEELPRKAGREIMRKGLKSAAGLWREEMVRRVVRGWHVWATGQRKYKGQKLSGRSREYAVLSKTIGMKLKLQSDELAGTIAVGPARISFWSLFLEFGTRGGTIGGPMAPQPFIRPTFDSAGQKVAANFKETITAELDRAGLKVNR